MGIYIILLHISLQAAQAAIAAGQRRRQLMQAVTENMAEKRNKTEVEPTPSTQVTPDSVKKPCVGTVTPRALSFSDDAPGWFPENCYPVLVVLIPLDMLDAHTTTIWFQPALLLFIHMGHMSWW